MVLLLDIPAVVLLDSYGADLHPLCQEFYPKYQVRLASKYLLEFPIEYLKSNGFRNIIIVVKGDQLYDLV